MKKEDITDEMATWWAHTHRTFTPRWQSSPATVADAKDRIGYRLQDYEDFAGSYYASDWVEVQGWAFRMLNYLTEEAVAVPRNPARPDSWKEVMMNVRRALQDEFGEAIKGTEPGETIWESWVSEPAAWFIENMTPFHVWCVYSRVMDDLKEEVLENVFSILDSREYDIARVAEESFFNAMQGFHAHLNTLTKEEAP